MPYKFKVQQSKRIRVILDTDAACEADDQYAICHALLTPKFDLRGIVAEQFNSQGGDKSVIDSYNEIEKVLELMDMTDVPHFIGSDKLLKDENDAPDSAGSDFIISEALRESDLPLYILCQGAITNVAAAINKCPEIADKFICIWIGGGFYPEGGWEFNLHNDYNAANVAFRSSVELWQVPMDCYTKMQVGYAELQRKVMPYGKIGRYLFEEIQELGMKANWVSGECWSLGDSAAIGIALNPGCANAEIRPAPLCDSEGKYVGQVNEHLIRVYHQIDSRFVLEDFFAKLALTYREI